MPVAGTRVTTLYKSDKNPSCGVNIGSGPSRGFMVAFNMNGNGKLGKPYATYSFWDVALDFLPGSTGDFKFVLYHYAKKQESALNPTRRPKKRTWQNSKPVSRRRSGNISILNEDCLTNLF